MKNILSCFLIAGLMLAFQACAEKAPLAEDYNFKGGLSIHLPQKDFGVISEVQTNAEDILKTYQEFNPEVTQVETAMYDNFSKYTPIGFSYAYTKVNADIFADQAPFGFEDYLYDSSEDLQINGKQCRKSVITDEANNRTLTLLSCKDKNQSWDIFLQSFFAQANPPGELTKQERADVKETTQKMNIKNNIAVEEALKSIKIQ